MVIEHLDGLNASGRKLGLTAIALETSSLIALTALGVFDPFRHPSSHLQDRLSLGFAVGFLLLLILTVAGLSSIGASYFQLSRSSPRPPSFFLPASDTRAYLRHTGD